ncbi:MAG: phage tail protein, partial [Delftia acidovorans]
MADLSYFHGVQVLESPDSPSLLRVTNYGITFINGTAPDADASGFPLNT